MDSNEKGKDGNKQAINSTGNNFIMENSEEISELRNRLTNLDNEIKELKSVYINSDSIKKHEDSSFQKALKLFGFSLNVILIFLGILSFFALLIGFQGYSALQYQKKMEEQIAQKLRQEEAKIERLYRVLPYRARINMAIETLNNPKIEGWKKDEAIWELKNILQSARNRPEFCEVAKEYIRVLPQLDLKLENRKFSESYRGELWICAYMLESGDKEVIDKLRKKISIKKIKEIQNSNLDQVPYNKKGEFEEAVNRIEQTVGRS